MKVEFKNLILKNKSELQEIADEKNINYSQTTKRPNLIEKICKVTGEDLSGDKGYMLSLGADGVKKKAKEYNVEYTTKKKTISKIAEKIDSDDEEDDQQKTGSWREEFEKALDLAIKNVLTNKMKYNIYEKVNDPVDNVFNVSPAYMKSSGDSKLLITINPTEYAKDSL